MNNAYRLFLVLLFQNSSTRTRPWAMTSLHRNEYCSPTEYIYYFNPRLISHIFFFFFFLVYDCKQQCSADSLQLQTYDNKICALNLGHYTGWGGGGVGFVLLSNDCKLICESRKTSDIFFKSMSVL